MKASKVRELTTEELQDKHADWLSEYFGLRIKHALGQLENPLTLRDVRRNIARAKTILKEQGVEESTLRRRRSASAATKASKK